MQQSTILDCTLRDGGYYNSWDFPESMVHDYLSAMTTAGVNVVELGFRFLNNRGFKGPYAYSKDDFLSGLDIPSGLSVSVMINSSDLMTSIGCEGALEKLFPKAADETKVDLVRIASHYSELAASLDALKWLKARGYKVGINLMQVTSRSQEELENLSQLASDTSPDVLYFADSTGGLTPDATAQVVGFLRSSWQGAIGIHTHDNLGLALANTLRAEAEGATWLDATVTGMGRGPGNARTEELVIEKSDRQILPLLKLISDHFAPLKVHHEWGTNPYYYLAGKHNIHPTYVQEMLSDPRFDVEDIFGVIDDLRERGGTKFSYDTLDIARQFYDKPEKGNWTPSNLVFDKEVILLGAGSSANKYRDGIAAYIQRAKPIVFAVNTQAPIQEELIDLRIACHPVRLMADAGVHIGKKQPLVTPASMLPESVKAALVGKEVHDFSLKIQPGQFVFGETGCTVPSALVLAYALAVAASGGAKRILMAGFDGYSAGDLRNSEEEEVLRAFLDVKPHLAVAITPTNYRSLPCISLYGI